MRVYALLILLCAAGRFAMAEAVWIDTDAAIGSPFRDVDDGYALVLAFHSPELYIAGLSTTYGNGSLKFSTRVVREMTRRFGRPAGLSAINVHPGAGSARELGQATTATKALAAALRDNKQLTYIALGPLTNVASLLQLHPELSNRFKRIVFIGGKSPEVKLGFGPRGSFRIHDANVIKDPAAVSVVLRSGIPLFLAPVETASRLQLGAADLKSLRSDGSAGRFLYRESRVWFWFWTDFVRAKGGPIFDALAVLSVAKPELMRTEKRYVRVDPSGNLLAARHREAGSVTVRFATGYAQEAKTLILRRLRRIEP